MSEQEHTDAQLTEAKLPANAQVKVGKKPQMVEVTSQSDAAANPTLTLSNVELGQTDNRMGRQWFKRHM